jgi:hypothetical protein
MVLCKNPILAVIDFAKYVQPLFLLLLFSKNRDTKYYASRRKAVTNDGDVKRKAGIQRSHKVGVLCSLPRIVHDYAVRATPSRSMTLTNHDWS